MIFFKSCVRCAGDRSLEGDHYGSYVICLSCGYVTYPGIAVELKAPVEESQSTEPEPAAPRPFDAPRSQPSQPRAGAG